MDSASVRNEFNAIRLCVFKAIGATSYAKADKRSNIKTVSVDMPCSQLLFRNQFVSKLTDICYFDDNSFKFSVTPSELNVIFGDNWHTYHYRHSSTQRRIIGLMQIHFRQKTIQPKKSDR